MLAGRHTTVHHLLYSQYFSPQPMGHQHLMNHETTHLRLRSCCSMMHCTNWHNFLRCTQADPGTSDPIICWASWAEQGWRAQDRAQVVTWLQAGLLNILRGQGKDPRVFAKVRGQTH